MNLKSRLKPFSALAFTSLVIASLGAGCSDVKNLQDAACCDGFKVGTVMTAADFNATINASAQTTFAAFANAASDLSATATGAIADVTTACQNIALDLGADAADPSVTNVTGKAAMSAWCTLAKAQIDATVGVKGTLATGVHASFELPKCSASLSATANCQASCNVSGSCDIKANPPTCTGGKLSVECSGGCTAEGTAALACTGSCSGSCKGSCQASGGATVDCKGKCDGTCTAGAMGSTMGNGIQADGSCQGQCSGTCEIAADAPKLTCTGTCDGTCDAKCSATATVKAKCDGKCDADYTPLKCEGGTLSGGCMVDADCQGSCNASASAKAECSPPSISITVTAKAGLSADAQLQLQTAIASLEANLPKILVVFKARGQAFGDNLSAFVQTGGSLTGKVGAKGSVCAILVGAAVVTASDNFAAAFSAAGDVAGSIKLN